MYAAIAPFGLLLLSSVWMYPAVLEEVVKWGILRLTANGVQLTVGQGALVGLMFGLSEAVLYSMNAWGGGQWGAMGMRLLVTVPMHMVTAWVIAVFLRRGWGVMGVLIAVVIHMGFNIMVGH